MPNYRRSRIPGGYYFFTVVSFERAPIFLQPSSREFLRLAWLDTVRRFPFRTIAICLLPEHIHCIWKLPDGDCDFSIRWREIKRLFSKDYLRFLGPTPGRNPSRVMKNEAAVWHRRFWEHSIRDQDDLAKHIAYIHFNPVKHGLAARVLDWKWSSFHRYVVRGILKPDWGGGDLSIRTGE